MIWCSIDRLAYRPTLFWLDCYLLHWRGRYPLDGTIAAFEQLKSTSKILSWDVSNFDIPDLEDVRKIAGEGNLVCNQVLYQLEERAIEDAVAPQCEKHGVAVFGSYGEFERGVKLVHLMLRVLSKRSPDRTDRSYSD